MKTEEIERIAKDFAMQVYPKEPYEDIGQMEFLRDSFVKTATKTIMMLTKTHCVVEKSKVTNEFHKYFTNLQQLKEAGYDNSDPDVVLCEGIISTLTTIFSKELFEEEEK